ncbi:EVE domain-containing protein [Psychrobacter sp. I-STPA10]|uniref:EVE domain-containing protein n=1 Tax=Psychrobacter sp. I-STPA10 TaxID=2585769 RepID=UPI001E4CCBD2|nr:EVE domain-containing protein [Psychrobacter sp. I-STPA10]
MQYWLMKSEPTSFSIHDLQQVRCEPWDGVRNYQARNFMRDAMQVGDKAFLYHSNTKKIGIAGIMSIASTGYPDPTQFNPECGYYYDPKSTEDNPRWYLVDVQFEQAFSDILLLSELKTLPQLDDCLLTQKGSRLSVMPLQVKHWQAIMQLAEQKGLL